MNIALIGYGKMGKAIEEIALQRGHTIVLKTDHTNREDLTADNLHLADVAIEFTGPESALDNILFCLQHQVPVVSGSTGWLKDKAQAEAACTEHNGTFLYASNFSIGVNLFFQINQYVAQLMNRHPQYKVSLEEIHHTQKLDAPSGTAITLAEQVLEQVAGKTTWVNHATNKAEELAIISKRIDPAPGTHSVKYESDIDDIEIIHTAHNRKGFASGAVLAAEFIHDKKGIFTMKQVLGL